MEEPLAVGDRVAFKADFCANTGNYAGNLPHARGVIQSISRYNIAMIQWDGEPEDVPPKVHINNLCRVGGPGFSRT
jgi:hypothetical protein